MRAGDDGPHYTNNWSYFDMLDRPTAPRAGGPADVSPLESSWSPAAASHDATHDIDSWDTDLVLLATVPDPTDISETVRHAIRLLSAFTSAVPPIAGGLSVNQQRLLSAALAALLANVPASPVDGGTQTDGPPAGIHAVAQTDPLLPLVDLSMRPDSTCVVCFTRMTNTVLAPCWHLVLCLVPARPAMESCRPSC